MLTTALLVSHAQILPCGKIPSQRSSSAAPRAALITIDQFRRQEKPVTIHATTFHRVAASSRGSCE
jgi:hypothetical protein